jgi:hypothetical protein
VCPPGGFGEQYPGSYPELAEYQYQAAWRTSQWTLPSKVTQLLESKEQAGFHESAFGALRSLHDGDRGSFLTSLRYGIQSSSSDAPPSRGRCGLLQELLAADLLESTKHVHPVLSRLRFFSEVEGAWPLLWNTAEAAVRLGVTQVHRSSDNTAALVRVQDGWRRYGTIFAARLIMGVQVRCTVELEQLRGAGAAVIAPRVCPGGKSDCLPVPKPWQILDKPLHMAQELGMLAVGARKARRYQIALDAVRRLRSFAPGILCCSMHCC